MLTRCPPTRPLQVIAVREGNLTMVGQPKWPAFTQLNTTANVGDTNITVNGQVSPGDRPACHSVSQSDGRSVDLLVSQSVAGP